MPNTIHTNTEIENTIISSLQKQLDQLADLLPQLKDSTQPTGQCWTNIYQELEHLFGYTKLQELVSEVITAISEITDTVSDVDNLTQTLATLIQTKLDLYYVGIFLVDKDHHKVELHASADQTGKRKSDRQITLNIDKTTTIGRAIQKQCATVTTDHKKTDVTIDYIPHLPKTCAEIVLPLVNRGEILGVLTLLSTEASFIAPSKSYIKALQPLATHVANAIQTTQLFATIDRQLEQMAALYHISLQVGGHLNIDLQIDKHHLDFDTLLNDLAQLSLKLADADASVIRLFSSNHHTSMMVSIATNISQGFSRERLDEAAALLSDRVAATKQPILANNWPHHPLAAEYPTISAAKDDILALMNVPIVLRGRTIGTIEIQSFTKTQAFNESDLHILSLLASQAAMAIENAHLFNRAENNSRFLKMIIEHIPDPIFIKDQNHIWIEMNQANAKVIGQPHEQLIGKTDHDFFPQELAAEFYRRADEVFATHQNLTFEDKMIWADGKEHIAHTRLIPIPGKTDQPEYLLGIWQDISERKAREAEKEKLLSEMAMLYNGSQTIANALSEKQLFDALFQQFRTQDPDKIFAYYFKVVDDELLWVELETYWPADTLDGSPSSSIIGDRIYLPASPQARLFTRNEPLFSKDITTDERLSTIERNYLLAHNTRSLASLPMTTTGQEIGVILICFAKTYTFTATIKRFWQAMVDQASVLLANRCLIQEVTYRAIQIETAAEVAHIASAILDVQQLLTSTVNLIRDRFDFYYVGVFLVDETKEWAVLRAGTGEAGRIQLEKKHRLKIGGESMIGWCLVNLKARVALDIGKDAIHFQNPHLPDTHSELALPLIHRRQPIGAVTVQSTEQAAFSQQDIIALQTMTDQLANAIQNAHLFEQAQQEIIERERVKQEILRRNDELAAINHIARVATSTLDLRTILQDTAQELVQIFHAYASGIALLNSDQTELTVIADYCVQTDRPSSIGFVIPVTDNPSSQYVVETGKSLVLSDAQHHSMTEPIHELLQKRQTQCLMIVPMLARGEVIGTLGLDIIEINREFTLSEIELAETIARQIAGAVANARLFEQTQTALFERQRAEAAIRQAEEKYRSIVQNSVEGIFQTTPEGRYLSVNPALARIYKYESPEILIAKLTDIGHQLYVDPNRRTEFMRLMDKNDAVSTFESQIYRQDGSIIWISEHARAVRDNNGQLLYYEGTVTDITQRKQAEEALRTALERTQSLYRLSDALTTSTDDQRIVFETVLGEYLCLLDLEQGCISLVDQTNECSTLQALYIDGQPVESNLTFAKEQDLIGQHLDETPVPLIIKDVRAHPATKNDKAYFGQVRSRLLIPLIIQDKVIGRISADSPEVDHPFSQDDIEIGQAIADQLAIWLEKRQLLEETRKRSYLLQTAAEVSRTAGAILDVNELINRSVDLICDKFDFYYVGLFLIDPEKEWAVLRAGTGQAGRIQLAKNHRLKIGGESMIGWCIQHRQARIALDVGEEAVHFQNPDLPDTHSEIALPLISRDEILGALTAQSVERNAFSDEDITLLQTMADQLANTIKNAHLFEEVTQAQEEAEDRLQETIALQQLSQALSGTLQVEEVLDIFFRACTKVIGFEYVLFFQVDKIQHHVKAITGVGVTDNHIKRANYPLDSNNIIADIVRSGKTEVLTGWDDRFDKEIYDREGHADWVRIFIPVTLRQENIGLVETGFKHRQATITEFQIRLLRAFIDQTVLALDNAQRYEASQRTARREALIKEITTKVRASADIDTILQTTVKEVNEALQGKRVYVNLISPQNGNQQNNKETSRRRKKYE